MKEFEKLTPLQESVIEGFRLKIKDNYHSLYKFIQLHGTADGLNYAQTYRFLHKQAGYNRIVADKLYKVLNEPTVTLPVITDEERKTLKVAIKAYGSVQKFAALMNVPENKIHRMIGNQVKKSIYKDDVYYRALGLLGIGKIIEPTEQYSKIA